MRDCDVFVSKSFLLLHCFYLSIPLMCVLSDLINNKKCCLVLQLSWCHTTGSVLMSGQNLCVSFDRQCSRCILRVFSDRKCLRRVDHGTGSVWKSRPNLCVSFDRNSHVSLSILCVSSDRKCSRRVDHDESMWCRSHRHVHDNILFQTSWSTRRL